MRRTGRYAVSDDADDSSRCPSAPATEGALLIGVVTADGRVANLGTPLPVDAAFIETAKAHGAPEQRFRFSSPCQKERCVHWKHHECGLIGELYTAASEVGEDLAAAALPCCSIRADCRWWRQRGRAACAVCPLVVTDTRSTNVADMTKATELRYPSRKSPIAARKASSMGSR
jgi:hypothetical protein